MMWMIIPAATEALILALAVGVWRRLRRWGLNGVYQLLAGMMIADAFVQGAQLGLRWGQPAGAAWLLHLSASGVLLYVLYRLGHLCWARRRRRAGALLRQWVMEEGG